MKIVNVGSCVKISDESLETFGRFSKVRGISGIYDITIPNEETPDFLKELNIREIHKLIGMGVIGIPDILFLEDEVLSTIEYVIVYRDGEPIENCKFENCFPNEGYLNALGIDLHKLKLNMK